MVLPGKSKSIRSPPQSKPLKNNIAAFCSALEETTIFFQVKEKRGLGSTERFEMYECIKNMVSMSYI